MATLTTVRQLVGQQLGRYWSGTANSSGNSTVTIVDDQIKSTLSINKQFEDWWVTLPAAAAADNRVSRRVASFAASTGTLTVDRAYSASTIPDAAAYELHGFLEPITDLGDALNAAMKRLMLVVEVTVTPVANAIRHDLTTANTWLTDPLWVRQVGYLVSGETRATANPFSAGRRVTGYTTKDSGIVYLNHDTRTFASNETIYLRCFKPAYAHCRTATDTGTYGEKTTGLTAEANQSEVEDEALAAGTIVTALERGTFLLADGEDADLARSLKRQAQLWTYWCGVYDRKLAEDGRLTLKRAPYRLGSSYATYR